MLIPLRKAQAGSDSLGHIWEEDGAVVRVSPAHAEVLLAIKDAGFTVADDSWSESQASESDEVAKTAEFSEVDPKGETTVSAPGEASDEDGTEAEGDTAKPSAKKAAARKATVAKQA